MFELAFVEKSGDQQPDDHQPVAGKAFDAAFLFHASFERAGDDLKLVAKDGAGEVVAGYFTKDDDFAPLRATNGALLSGDLIRALAGPQAPGQYAQANGANADGAQAAPAAQDIGHIAKLQGSVTIIRNGVAITVSVGDVVLRGDVIQTGGESSAGIVFKDGSAFEIFHDARLVLSEFDYSGKGSAGSQLFSLVQGSFSFVSGDIAASGDMRIATAGGIAKIHSTAGGGEIASDNGQVKLYIYHQRDGRHEATITDSTGNVIATLRSDGGRLVLTPTPSSEYSTVEIIKTAEELTAERNALYEILKLKNGADALMNVSSTGTQGSSYIAPPASPDVEPVGGPPQGATPVTIYLPPPEAPAFDWAPVNNYIPNFAPFGGADNYEVDEDGIVGVLGAGVLANDHDMEAAKLGVYLVRDTAHGKLTLNFDGSFIYVPDADYNGTDTFLYRVFDGTLTSEPVQVILTINAVNDAPVLALNPATTPVVTFEQVPVAILPALSLTDIDSSTMARVMVSISGNYQPGEDVLTFVDTASIHGVFDARTGTLTLTAVAGASPTVAEFEAALRSVTYVDTIDNPTQLARTITVVVQDVNGVARGGDDTSSAITTLTVTPVNDVPTILSADGHAVTEETNASAQDILPLTGDLTVNDRDIGDRLTASITGDAVAVYSGGALPPGVDVSMLLASAAVSFSDAISTGRDLALRWTYDPAAANIDWLPKDATLTLTYLAQVNDGTGNVGSQPLTIVITGTNDAVDGDFVTAVDVMEAGDASAQAITASGSWNVTDLDIGDNFTVSVAGIGDIQSSTGSFPPGFDASGLIDPAALSFTPTLSDGGRTSIAWSYSGGAADFDWLAEGDQVSIGFAISVNDGASDSDVSYLYVTIFGTNDVPNITGATSLSVTELAYASAQDIDAMSGTLTVNDLDIGDTINASVIGDATAVWSGGELPAWFDASALIASGAITFGSATTNGGDTSLTWTYDPAAAYLDWLAQGATLTLTYTAQVNDGYGNVGSQPLTIVITGVNDGPSGYIFSFGGDVEDADATAQAISATGTWDVLDVDVGDTLTVSPVAAGEVYYMGGDLPPGFDVSSLIDPSLLTFAPAISNGGTKTMTWTYSAPAASLDWLADGFDLYVIYDVRVSDGTSTSTDAAYIYIIFTGTNDAPTITGATALAAAELPFAMAQHIAPTAGMMTVNDLDLGDTLRASVTGDATAVWSGGELPAGINIAALIASNALTIGPGTSNGADVNMLWLYNPAAANLDWLAKDATLTITYTAQVNDGFGNVGSQPLTIVITGTNDAPSVDALTFGSVAEADEAGAQVISASGTWTVRDLDIGDNFTVTVTGNGDAQPPYGRTFPVGLDVSSLINPALLSFAPAVSNGGATAIGWIYSGPAANLDWLRAGEELNIVFEISVNDGTTNNNFAYLFVTVVGTNDQAVIIGATSPGSVLGGAIDSTPVTGTLTVKDADIGDSLSGYAASNATYVYSGGTLPVTANADGFASMNAISFTTVTANGDDQALTWTYTPPAGSFGWLRPGERITLTYNVQVSDDAGFYGNQQVTVTVTGSNNAPTITASSSQISEAADASNQAASTTGALVVRDPNYDDALSVTVSGNGTATYSGTLPSGVNLSALAATSALTLGTATSNGGDVSISWTYNAGAMNLDWMRAGTTITISYNVVANDGIEPSNASTVTVVITGTNDGPIIAAATNPSPIAESQAGISAVAGTLSITDLDVGDTLSASVSGNATVSYSGGTLPTGISATALGASSLIAFDSTISNGGGATLNWSYAAASNAFDWLGGGETLTLTYTARVNDGSGNAGSQPLVITINGENDGAVVTSGAQAVAITEDFSNTVPTGSVVTNGTFENSPYINGAYVLAGWTSAGFLYSPGAGPVGHSGISAANFASRQNDPPGTMGQTVSTVAGLHYTLEFWAVAGIRAGSSIAVLWNGQTVAAYSNVPYVTGTNPTSSSEYTKYTVDVVATSSSSSLVFSIFSPYYLFLDDVSLKAVITPGLETAKGSITFTDTDLADTHTVSVASNVNVGNFTATLANDSTGGATGKINWTYDVTDVALAFLRAQQVLTQTYRVLINDGHGGTTSQDVVVTVTGVNDAPSITGAISPPSISESQAGVAAVAGTLRVTDLDIGDTLSASVTGNATVTYSGGNLPAGISAAALGASSLIAFDSVTSNGGAATLNWTYAAASDAFDWLGAGQTLTITYSARVNDGSGNVGNQPISITITGENDGPVVTSVTQSAITFTDADFVDTHTVSIVPNSNIGNFTATLANDSTNGASGRVNFGYTNGVVPSYLAAGQTLNQTYTIVINDGRGGTISQDVAVTVTGVNDAPVLDTARTVALNPQLRGTTAPSGAVGTLVSQLVGIGTGANNVIDADNGAVAGIAITATSGMAGTWYYSTNNGTSWMSFTASAASARLLTADSTTRIYFQPNSGTVNGTGTITFQAWDGSSGSNGGTGNASVNGGTTAFSTGSETASIFIGAASSNPTTLSSSSDTVFFASGNNTVNGSLLIVNSTLNSGDNLTGGTGIDTFNLTVNGSLTGSFNFGGMTRFSGFDVVRLASNPSRSTSLTFGNSNVTSDQTMTVDGSALTTASRSFTVDASGVTNGGSFIFIPGASTYSYLYGGSGNDTFRMTNAQFARTGHELEGGAGFDTVQITDAASIADSAFSYVTGVDRLQLANFSNTVGLTGFANTAFTGPLTIDNSAATAGNGLSLYATVFIRNLLVVTGAGDDLLWGGHGNDIFQFKSGNLTAADIIDGGLATDTIQITDSANLSDAVFTNVTNVEKLLLGDFNNSITLGTLAGAAIGSGTLTIDASAAGVGRALTVDATALTATAHLSIFGGAGDDMFVFANAHFTSSERISGGAGTDTIRIADAATIVDSDFTNVTSVEVLKLGDFANNVTLGSSAAAASGTGTLTVDGSTGGAGSPLTVNASAMAVSAHVNIIGGAGNDFLNGSAGSDLLTGGAGQDTFVFTNLQNSLAANFDTITDFASGTDFFQIGHTLSALTTGLSGAGTGNLIADLAGLLDVNKLQGNGAAEVVLTSGSDAGTYLVIGDASGGFDGMHDAVIKLANDVVLHQADFIV